MGLSDTTAYIIMLPILLLLLFFFVAVFRYLIPKKELSELDEEKKREENKKLGKFIRWYLLLVVGMFCLRFIVVIILKLIKMIIH